MPKALLWLLATFAVPSNCAYTCNLCWARSPEAVIPGDASTSYIPGLSPGTGDRVCPDELPFVSGMTESLCMDNCIDPYHGKKCSQLKCCRATYECYGNCGDYSALYILFAVLAGLGVICLLYKLLIVGYDRRQARRRPLANSDASLDNKVAVSDRPHGPTIPHAAVACEPDAPPPSYSEAANSDLSTDLSTKTL